jgi:hypothetical protein
MLLEVRSDEPTDTSHEPWDRGGQMVEQVDSGVLVGADLGTTLLTARAKTTSWSGMEVEVRDMILYAGENGGVGYDTLC